MEFIGWSFDVAREQSLSPDRLSTTLRDSGDAGYNALGLYLEHRFRYPSAPFATADGCLRPEDVRATSASARAARVRLIPFLNTLGHMEGFIRAEGGQWLAEGPASGSLQMCATRAECRDFARGLVRDALAAFDDEWVHLGGDETRQLGQCARCEPRVREAGPAALYAEYFAPLCEWVLKQGRRPALWGDMLLKHPEALAQLPRQTLIFDWQYFQRPLESTQRFRDAGFDVVCCPSLQTYNSGWCFWDATREILDQHLEDAQKLGARGVMLTTWEFSYFSQFAPVQPLVLAAGRRMARGQSWHDALRAAGGESYAEAAETLGVRLPAASAFLKRGSWRRLRDALVIRQNPFQLWLRWPESAGADGTRVLELCTLARHQARGDARLDFAILLHETAIHWVRIVQAAAAEYRAGRSSAAAQRLRDAGVETLARLRPGLVAAAAQGGASADGARLDKLIARVHEVAARLDALAACDSTAFRPAFECVCHDGYVHGDQAGWRSSDPYEPPRNDEAQ